MQILGALTLSVVLSLVTVVPPAQGERCSNRVLFLTDMSGSMHGHPLDLSFQAILTICAQPMDDYQFGVLTFSDINKQERWPGIPEDNNGHPIPAGWAGLPSAVAADKAHVWLSNERRKGGSTKIIPGLRRALREQRQNLTIVLVTDGILDEHIDLIITALRAGQKERLSLCAAACGQEEHSECPKLAKALIICLGIGPKQDALVAIAQEGRGGYYTEAEESPEEELTEADSQPQPQPTQGPQPAPTPNPGLRRIGPYRVFPTEADLEKLRKLWPHRPW